MKILLKLLILSNLFLIIINITANKTMDNKTTANKTTPNKTIANKTTPNKTTPNKTTPNKTTPNKTIANKTTPNKTTPNKTTPNKTTPNKTTDNKTIANKTTPNKTNNDDTEVILPRNNAAKNLFKDLNILQIYKEDKRIFEEFKHYINEHIRVTDELLTGKVPSTCKNIRDRVQLIKLPDIEILPDSAKDAFQSIYKSSYHLYKKDIDNFYDKKCGKKHQNVRKSDWKELEENPFNLKYDWD